MDPIRFTVNESYFSSSPSTRSGGVNGAEPSGEDVQQVIVAVALGKPGLSDGKQIQIISNEMMTSTLLSRALASTRAKGTNFFAALALLAALPALTPRLPGRLTRKLKTTPRPIPGSREMPGLRMI